MFKWIAGTVGALLLVHWIWPKGQKAPDKADVAGKFPFMGAMPASDFTKAKVGDVVALNVWPTGADPTNPETGKMTSVANVVVKGMGTYGPSMLVGEVVDVPSPALVGPAKHGDAVYVVEV